MRSQLIYRKTVTYYLAKIWREAVQSCGIHEDCDAWSFGSGKVPTAGV